MNESPSRRPPSTRPVLLGAIGALAVLSLGLSANVRGAAAALVQVTNGAANPVMTKAVDDPARTAFGTRVFPNVRSAASIQVPPNKYLVIDTVIGFTNGSTVTDVEIGAQTAGTGTGTLIPFALSARPGSWLFTVPTPVRIVADPGSTVYISVEDSNFNDSAGINVDLKGYYVDATP